MKLLCVVLLATAVLLLSCQLWAGNTVVFFDDFNNGASPMWGNQVGNWTAQSGVYYAQNPWGATYTLLPYNLTDFTINVHVNGTSDGGIWLRSDANADTALVLIIGGESHSGTGVYFHDRHNGDWYPPINMVGGLFSQGDNIHVTVVATGDLFEVYLNGSSSPVDSIVYNRLTSGYVGLYDNTGQGHFAQDQSFDNFDLQGTTAVPEPMTLLLVGGGLMAGYVRRRMRA